MNHLRAYESNGLSVDPAGLPLDAALEATTKTVAPRRGGGVPVTFGVVQERSVLVTLMTKTGATPPAGAEVYLGDRMFPLGYGGEVYLRGVVVGRNVIRVLWRERDSRGGRHGAGSAGRHRQAGARTHARPDLPDDGGRPPLP